MSLPLQKIHCLYDRSAVQAAVALQEELRHRVKLVALARPVWLVADLPTTGEAKSRLVGEGMEPDLAAGSSKALIWKGKQVGLILRTQEDNKILPVAPGRHSPWPECLETTLGGVTRYQLPLPVRQADRLRA